MNAQETLWSRLVDWLVTRRLIVAILTALVILGGLIVEPFGLIEHDLLPRDRVAVDALPDIGEHQHIVFTRWSGRSPRDIEDQITYPLTSALLGLPGIKTVRSQSILGFSSIYVIFEDSTDYYWARTRILERLSSMPEGTLPEGVVAQLGPDATALGQVFWYTLEARDEQGAPASGWDLHELRSLQDWVLKPALQAVPGVAEVASIGGHVREYQIDVDPRTLLANDVDLMRLADAVRQANMDIGARTMEINRLEYVVRGVGQVKSIKDLEQIVVAQRDGRPIILADVARVTLGPANRRGALDVAGADAVGGVVVSRYGANPVEVIEQLKLKLKEVDAALPQRTLEDGRKVKVRVIPFYDRSELVGEVLGTLSSALMQQILITIAVVLVLLGQLRASMLVSVTLPLGVLASFGLMKLLGVSANVMSLAGIAIAIGTMVDMGIVFVEAMVAKLEALDPAEHHERGRIKAISQACASVAPAVLTSTLTTVLSFLPVFGLTEAEGKLFGPLAYTKTFALLGAFFVALMVLPSLVHWLIWPHLKRHEGGTLGARLWRALTSADALRDWALVGLGVTLWWMWGLIYGAVPLLMGGMRLIQAPLDPRHRWLPSWVERVVAICGVTWMLTQAWLPLGHGKSFGQNLWMVASLAGGLLLLFWLFLKAYPSILRWALAHMVSFLSVPLFLLCLGLTAWLGASTTLGWLPTSIKDSGVMARVFKAAPGFGSEFMPSFDEGSYLYMPTTMPHASFGQAQEQLSLLDVAIKNIPEVEDVVGKLGRVESTLDPAPVSMFEVMVRYKPQWRTDERGERVRQWRDHIKGPDDIWQEIVHAAQQPGLTSAPKLMPINTRIVMLQSGMRAPMGVKVKGPTLEAIERAGLLIEAELKQVEALRPETVFAERVVGKPYLEIRLKRPALGRYGLSVDQVQRVLSIALGGMPLTTTIEGRERYAVRVRYAREERDDPEALSQILVPTPSGAQVKLEELAEVLYVKGPQMIKSEETFLTSVVIFDKRADMDEIGAVRLAQARLSERINSGDLVLPEGVSYAFAGSYQNQLRSQARLALLVPLALLLIVIVLYLQFGRLVPVLLIFTSVGVAVSGGFLLIWMYQQPGFMDVTLFGESARELFQVGPMNMSVAVWVGFIALIGIATDDGVVMATYLSERFEREQVTDWSQIKALVLEAGMQRVRPCLMTTATTLLALLPVLTSRGRGSDVMVPMAVPVLGGMAVELVTLFVVPVLWGLWERSKLLRLESSVGDEPVEPIALNE